MEVLRLRFILASAVDALLARSPTPSRADIEELPVTTCDVAASTDRFFTFAVFETPPLIPTMWSLVENTRISFPPQGAPATMTIVATQGAGSMGGVVTRTQIVWPADGGPARTIWLTSTEIRPGFPAPDGILDQVIPQAKDPPRRRLLESLRARAQRESRAQ